MTPFVPDDPRALVAYDFALRPDLIIRLSLPVGLTTEDLARLVGFLSTLAFKAGALPQAEPKVVDPIVTAAEAS